MVGTKGRITADWQTMTVLSYGRAACRRLCSIQREFCHGARSHSRGLRYAVRYRHRQGEAVPGSSDDHRSVLSGPPAWTARTGLAGAGRAQCAPDGPDQGSLLGHFKSSAPRCRSDKRRTAPDPGDRCVRISRRPAGGSAVGARSRGTGHYAAGLPRPPAARVEWVQCDLTPRRRGGAGSPRSRRSIHCAALCGAPGSLKEFEEANVHGTVRLLRLAARPASRTSSTCRRCRCTPPRRAPTPCSTRALP